MSDEQELTEDLLRRLRSAVEVGEVIHTLTEQKANCVVDIDPAGVTMETDRSRKRETGPQLVPAWMIQVAWDHLVSTGELTNKQLLEELNVKRSSAVCALLACLDGVEVVSTRPIRLVTPTSS